MNMSGVCRSYWRDGCKTSRRVDRMYGRRECLGGGGKHLNLCSIGVVVELCLDFFLNNGGSRVRGVECFLILRWPETERLEMEMKRKYLLGKVCPGGDRWAGRGREVWAIVVEALQDEVVWVGDGW